MAKTKGKSKNPLFEQWVQEWYNEHEAAGNPKRHAYKKALISLKQCKEKLTPKETLKLNGIGKSISSKLEIKLKEYIDEHGEPEEIKDEESEEIEAEDESTDKPKKAKKEAKEYEPKTRSGAYALLIGFLIADKPQLKKAELIELATDYCDASFSVPAPGTRFTAWKAIDTLVSKELVRKIKTTQYALSPKGKELAKMLADREEIDYSKD